MMTEFEAGVRELVARLRDFERRMKKTEDDAGAIEQFVKLITPGLGFDAAGPPPPPPPNTVVSGTLRGCSSAGTGGAVEIFDTATMTSLGTATASATTGAYTLNIYLAANTGCTITGTPTSARLTAASITSTITAAVTNSNRNITCGVAAGFHCVSPCAIPSAETFTLTGSSVGDEGGCCIANFPNDTLTWQTGIAAPWNAQGSSGWLGAATFSQSGANCRYFVSVSGTLWRVTDIGGAFNHQLITGTTSCSPVPSWSQTCAHAVAVGLVDRFKGTVAE